MSVFRAIALLICLSMLQFTVMAQDAGTKRSRKRDETSNATKARPTIDINSASEADIEKLPGVGPATAKRIIAGRPYTSVEDLKKAGVSQRNVDKIAPMVIVGSTGRNTSNTATSVGKSTETSAAHKPSARKGSEASSRTTGATDLNTASQKELEALSGVGPATAKKIIAGRPYSSVEDLRKAGVSQGTIDKISASVTVGNATGASATARSRSTPSAATSVAPERSSPAQSAPRGSTSGSTDAENQTTSDTTQANTPNPGSGQVWVNTDSGIYHREGDRWYGKTKHGKYISEADAQNAGYRAAKR